VGGDLVGIFALAALAALNPTLLAAATVMMLLPNPKKLMFGYLLGAYTTSIACGLLIVFSLHGSGSTETARHTLSPIQDLVFGAIALSVAYAVGGGRTEALRERRRRRREKKQAEESESWPERMLGRGSARVTYAVGVLLSFPGVSYLAALDRTAKLDLDPALTTLIVLGVALVQQLLLEVPLLGFAFAPERTQEGIVVFREWLPRNGRRAGALAAATIGALLVLRGLVELLA
jgi:hypothetical protein